MEYEEKELELGGMHYEEDEVTDVREDDPEIEEGLEQEYEQKYGQTYSTEEWEKIVADYNSDNVEARNEAGEKAYFAMRPFIYSVARRLYGSYMGKYAEDLLSEGSLGLCESLKTYVPSASRPTTWCYRFIVHAMRDFIDREVHHTTPHYQSNIKKIREFVAAKDAAGEVWTFDDIVVDTGISLTTIINCMTIDNRNRNAVSIEQEMEDGATRLGELVPSNLPSPEEEYLKKERTEQLADDMKAALNDQERLVISLHYGMEDEIPRSAAEIEKLTGIRKQDVRPIINSAEYKLRKYMNYKEHYSIERRDRSREILLSILKPREHLAEELDSMIFEEDEEA